MDIRKAVLADHSKAQCLKIASFIGSSPEKFASLVDVYLTGPYRVTQRASWPLSNVVEKHPNLLIPHLLTILKAAEKHGVHDAVKRNTMRMLQYVEVPKRLHGRVVNLAFNLLQNRNEAIATRVFSMTVLENLLTGKPELLNELKLLVEDEMPYASAAFRSRGSKLLKRLNSLENSNKTLERTLVKKSSTS